MDPYSYTDTPKYQPHDIEKDDASEFYDAINRSSLTKELSETRPYVYWTMEIYDKSNGIKGGGGLGVLAADTRRVAQQLEVPFVVVTPFYRSESHQSIEWLSQTEYSEKVSPQDYGFEYVDEVTVASAGYPDTSLSVFRKILGSTQFVTMSEPNFGQLYEGIGSGDHRLYQEVALGFGGYKALKLVGIKAALTNVGRILGHVKGVGVEQKTVWTTAAKNYVAPIVMEEFYLRFKDLGVRPPSFLAKLKG
jgi:glucan phosphorylase